MSLTINRKALRLCTDSPLTLLHVLMGVASSATEQMPTQLYIFVYTPGWEKVLAEFEGVLESVKSNDGPK